MLTPWKKQGFSAQLPPRDVYVPTSLTSASAAISVDPCTPRRSAVSVRQGPCFDSVGAVLKPGVISLATFAEVPYFD